MPGISPKLPLEFSSQDGAYRLTKTLKETIRQNFKMLVLTSPGERMMIPEYGVGIRQYLFHNEANGHARSQIASRIAEQAAIYMPFLEIHDVDFAGEVDKGELAVRVKYSMKTLNITEILELNIT